MPSKQQPTGGACMLQQGHCVLSCYIVLAPGHDQDLLRLSWWMRANHMRMMTRRPPISAGTIVTLNSGQGSGLGQLNRCVKIMPGIKSSGGKHISARRLQNRWCWKSLLHNLLVVDQAGLLLTHRQMQVSEHGNFPAWAGLHL